jgi:hypothetical protein
MCGADDGFVSPMRTSADTNHGCGSSEGSGSPREDLRWLNATHLRIAHDESARVFVAVKDVSGVTIYHVDGAGGMP